MSGENQNANAIANNILNLKLQIHLYVPILLLLPCQKSMTPINIAENMMKVGITDVGVPVSIMYTYVMYFVKFTSYTLAQNWTK